MFDECFKSLDGRDACSSRVSLNSSISRALSIKTKTASVVTYGQQSGKGPGKSDAM